MERGSHARGVYPEWEQHEEETDTRIISEEQQKDLEEREEGTEQKNPKQVLTSAKNL